MLHFYFDGDFPLSFLWFLSYFLNRLLESVKRGAIVSIATLFHCGLTFLLPKWTLKKHASTGAGFTESVHALIFFYCFADGKPVRSGYEPCKNFYYHPGHGIYAFIVF